MSKTMADIITAHLDLSGDEYDLRYIAAVRRLANDVEKELTAAGFGLVAEAMEVAFDYGWREGKGWPTPSDIESGDLHHGQAQRSPFNPYRRPE
jgi:hypothetical protein